MGVFWDFLIELGKKLFDYCFGLVSIRDKLEIELVWKIVFVLWVIVFFGNFRNIKKKLGLIKFSLLFFLIKIINLFIIVWRFYFYICKGIFNLFIGFNFELKYIFILCIFIVYVIYRKVC